MGKRDIRGSVVVHFWRVLRVKGVRHVVRSGVEKVAAGPLVLSLEYRFSRLLRSRREFVAKGSSYRYFIHPYNNTLMNERIVEVPVVWKMVQERQGGSVLEVGNVLSHYFVVGHDVVDKYELAPGVQNIDVVDFRSQKRYDLIVSISTLEHVGWDENPGAKKDILAEPAKILEAISNLRAHLAPGGRLVVTVPLGYNPQLDRSLESGAVRFAERTCLKRVSASNKWKEVPWDECKGARYGSPYKFANAVIIGVIEGPGGGRP